MKKPRSLSNKWQEIGIARENNLTGIEFFCILFTCNAGLKTTLFPLKKKFCIIML